MEDYPVTVFLSREGYFKKITPQSLRMSGEQKYKEGDGHGVDFWSSPITFPGNMQLLKEFAEQTNFSYDYYADGGLTQNADGYWQTADAVSGATIAEGCTYLDMLKTLYDRIQNGEYEPAV